MASTQRRGGQRELLNNKVKAHEKGYKSEHERVRRQRKRIRNVKKESTSVLFKNRC